MKRLFAGIGIGIGALVLTTLGISASQSIEGLSGSLLSMVAKQDVVLGCGEGAVEFVSNDRVLCVDVFEASAHPSCPTPDPQTALESEKNLATASCIPQSVSGQKPWRFINLSQAQRACAAAGKRLLSSDEWYRVALGTNPETMDCHLKRGNEPRTTQENTCKSTAGAYDMVGNVWEWIDEESQGGIYRDRTLPESGYVTGVDSDGIAVSTRTEQGDQLYSEDYFWHSNAGVRGMLRGGSYGLESDGGLYATHTGIETSFASAGIGFRCVRERGN